MSHLSTRIALVFAELFWPNLRSRPAAGPEFRVSRALPCAFPRLRFPSRAVRRSRVPPPRTREQQWCGSLTRFLRRFSESSRKFSGSGSTAMISTTSSARARNSTLNPIFAPRSISATGPRLSGKRGDARRVGPLHENLVEYFEIGGALAEHDRPAASQPVRASPGARRPDRIPTRTEACRCSPDPMPRSAAVFARRCTACSLCFASAFYPRDISGKPVP